MFDGILDKGDEGEGREKCAGFKGLGSMREVDLFSSIKLKVNVAVTDIKLMLKGDHGARLGVYHGTQETCQTPGKIPGHIRIGLNHSPKAGETVEDQMWIQVGAQSLNFQVGNFCPGLRGLTPGNFSPALKNSGDFQRLPLKP